MFGLFLEARAKLANFDITWVVSKISINAKTVTYQGKAQQQSHFYCWINESHQNIL